MAKKTAKTKAAKRKSGGKKAVKKATLTQWLSSVRTMAVEAAGKAKPRGACLVANPGGGPRVCIVTDRDTCKAIKGTFVGGPC